MIVPGEPGVPMVRNQSAPLASTCAATARVSTLSTAVGLLSPELLTDSASQPPDGAVANRPCCHGGRRRGSGSRPSMTSRRAFSSPKR